MNIASWLERTALAHPDAAAVAVGTSTAFSYVDLMNRSSGLASAFATRYGLAPGDRIAVACENHRSYVEILFAAWRGGFVVVPVNIKLHPSEMTWIIEHSGARVAVVTGSIASQVDAASVNILDVNSREYEALTRTETLPLVPRRADDLAWLFYTSGTTGRPKGAMLTFRNLIAMTQNHLAHVDTTGFGDALLHCAPMSHGSGMYVMGQVARAGVNVVPESGGFDTDETFRLLGALPRPSMFAAPTMIQRLTSHPDDAENLGIRTIIWGGAPIHVERIKEAIERFGPCFAQIYGQGESPMTIASLSKELAGNQSHPRWLARLASAGIPSPAVEVRTSDGDGCTPAIGELGEVIVRGDTVMSGYWNDDEASKAALDGGWLRTGDIGSFDDEGFLTLRDRRKDVIISGGSNIYPREVEDVLLRHTDVRDASVIGRPDAEWGEIVVAYVVGETAAEELDALCLQHLGRFKRPKDYVFVNELPQSGNGKILKSELREMDRDRT